MLILSRRVNESLRIGDDVIVTISSIDGKREQVKIGIEAPKEISVHRSEIYQKIKMSKQK